ncbi:MAG TPA: hypothetical protein VER36_04385, partial [Flavisolibacter sp.]|nr:hypothetical protein [Flavisolibacter sp.]
MKKTKNIFSLFLRRSAGVAIVVTMVLLSCSKKGSDNTGGGGPTPAPTPAPTPDTIPSLATVKGWLVDKNATEQTAALFYNLKKVSKTNILFGHQDATKRGVTNASTEWANE